VNRAVSIFIAIAYALSIALSLVVGLTGGQDSPFFGLRYLSMIIPAVAVLAVRFAMNERVRVDWGRLPLQYVPVALFLMPAVLHLSMLPVTAAIDSGLPWQDWLTPQTDGLYHTPPERGWGTLTTGALLNRIAINAITGVIIASILSFFEEIGWRAWLLPRLAERMGPRRAIVVTSVIWAFWHTPYAFSGIHHIEGMSMAQTAALMPIAIAGSGLVVGWLWVRTESIWIVTFAHGALNSVGQYAFKYMRDTPSDNPPLVLAAGGLALLLVGSLLVSSLTHRGIGGTLHHVHAGTSGSALTG
jgi:CAAX protease family protein